LWYEFDVEVVVATHGEGGATIGIRSVESIEWEPAFNTGAVVDKTGAGDAFVAGFISAILEEKTYRQALTHGQLFASSAITKKGSTNGLPDRAEMDILYTQYCV
jgi:ribokinase